MTVIATPFNKPAAAAAITYIRIYWILRQNSQCRCDLTLRVMGKTNPM